MEKKMNGNVRIFMPPSFFRYEDYQYLLYMNGEENVDPESLPESTRAIIDQMIEKGAAETSETPLPPIEPWQRYKVYPSALIIHCKGAKPYTMGCVAVDEEYMVTILKKAGPGMRVFYSEMYESIG